MNCLCFYLKECVAETQSKINELRSQIDADRDRLNKTKISLLVNDLIYERNTGRLSSVLSKLNRR